MTIARTHHRGTAALIALCLAIGASASAQEATTGAIAGQIVDAQGLPVPGVTVTIRSNQGARSYVTDAEGRFLALSLTPGTYALRAELQGFRPFEQSGIQVGLGERVTVPPVTLRVGALTETVEVVGAPPIVDTTSATVGASLDSEFLARVPVSRQFSDTLYLAPGVAGSGGAGQANPSISGASGLENQYIIDGINVTDPGYGALGSYSIIFGSLGTAVPFDFIQEVQVRTAGYEAEFGTTGGVVNAITKSGSNVFRGTAFTYWQPNQFEAEYRQTELPNATRQTEAVNVVEQAISDAGVEVSGPIWRDRAFFFGAVDPQWRTTGLEAPGGFPLRSGGTFERERRSIVYSAKGTFQATSNHRFDASAFGDPSEGEMGPQRRTALLRTDTSGFSSLEFGGHNQTIRYEGVLMPQLLVTASFARAANYTRELPSVDTWAVIDTTITPDLVTGGVGYVEDIDSQNLQFQAKATYFVRDHEIRGGFGTDLIDWNNIIDRTGPSIVTPDGMRTATGANVTVLPDPEFGRIYRVTRANYETLRRTEQLYVNFFVQDIWRVSDRLTVKPGIRYEAQRLEGNLADFTFDNNWAPRIGAIWDPTGLGQTKIFANWGRYFARIPNDLAARALSADAGVTRADYFDPDLTRPVPAGVAAAGTTVHFRTAGLFPSDFDPEAASTYSDEWLIGAEHEVLPGFTLRANYSHRNFGRVLEDVGTAPVIAYFLNPSDLGSVEYFITNPSVETPIQFPQYGARFEEAIHDYDAVTLMAEKRFGDRWGLQTSYRWSRLHGTFEGFFRNDNGQSDPGITSLYDFPTDDPSYVALGRELGFRGDIRFLGAAGAGPLPLDRTHTIKAFGNYAFDLGLNLGIGLTLVSGAPLTALAAHPVYENDGEIPETPRGAGIQTFDDGFRERTSWRDSVDVHLDYGFRLTETRRLVVLADVFNLFNRRTALDYDNYTESTFTVANPDFGRVISYQTPLQTRVGLRFEF